MQLKNVICLRNSLGYNQKEFAEQLGVKQTTYNGYEKGIRDPGIDFLAMIAVKYNVGLDYLAGLTDDPTPIGIKKTTTPDESEEEDYNRTILMENYDGMNEAGKNELVKHSRLLVNSGEYKKCGEFGMGKGSA